MKDGFNEALAQFVAAAQIKVGASSTSVTLRYENSGPKYVRVMRTGPGERSAYCFVEKETGNVYKPKGWAGPEKKNPRSNIFAADHGVSGVTPYGCIYLR